MSFSDRELLARLIQCEAGGAGEAVMKAAAGVVMNRVHARGGSFARLGQGSLRAIVFQPDQFLCADDPPGGTARSLYQMRPEQIHYDIADWAMAGNRIPDAGEALWFLSCPGCPLCPDCPEGIRGCPAEYPADLGFLAGTIHGYCFYNPTDAYYQT